MAKRVFLLVTLLLFVSYEPVFIEALELTQCNSKNCLTNLMNEDVVLFAYASDIGVVEPDKNLKSVLFDVQCVLKGGKIKRQHEYFLCDGNREYYS